MTAGDRATLGADRSSGITSTVEWVPDLDPARRRALGEAVVALRHASFHPYAGLTGVAAAGPLERSYEDH